MASSVGGKPSLASPKVGSMGSPLSSQTNTVVAAFVPPDCILALRPCWENGPRAFLGQAWRS